MKVKEVYGTRVEVEFKPREAPDQMLRDIAALIDNMIGGYPLSIDFEYNTHETKVEITMEEGD